MVKPGTLATAVVASLVVPLVGAQTSQQDYINNIVNSTNWLTEYYDQSTGLWLVYDYGSNQYVSYWWNSGSIMSTLGNMVELNSTVFGDFVNSIYENSITAAPAFNGGSFLNPYYDDEAWWGLAWIKAYDVTQNQTYLDAAVGIFDDQLGGLGATCGGHWWDKPSGGTQYNNAIGNALYLNMAAALANRIPSNTTYADAANTEAEWFVSSGLINHEANLIYDSLDLTSCTGMGANLTYNQGATIGAFVEMYKLTQNETYLDLANNIATGAIAALATPNNGTLTEPGYPTAIEDTTGAQFKGVFARNLMFLQQNSPNDAYVTFLQQNADTIWANDRESDGGLGIFWQGPLLNVTIASTSSAMDCLVGAATVTGNGGSNSSANAALAVQPISQ